MISASFSAIGAFFFAAPADAAHRPPPRRLGWEQQQQQQQPAAAALKGAAQGVVRLTPPSRAGGSSDAACRRCRLGLGVRLTPPAAAAVSGSGSCAAAVSGVGCRSRSSSQQQQAAEGRGADGGRADARRLILLSGLPPKPNAAQMPDGRTLVTRTTRGAPSLGSCGHESRRSSSAFWSGRLPRSRSSGCFDVYTKSVKSAPPQCRSTLAVALLQLGVFVPLWTLGESRRVRCPLE